MRIAIVDDCENERNELCKRLSQSSFSRSYDIEICEYNSGTDFLNEAMQNRFDLVFMDIYMEKENGIDAAQKLRKFDKDCLLVFTTTSEMKSLICCLMRFRRKFPLKKNTLKYPLQVTCCV